MKLTKNFRTLNSLAALNLMVSGSHNDTLRAFLDKRQDNVLGPRKKQKETSSIGKFRV